MLCVTLVSAIISGISSRPTQAESLLYKTTCDVGALLGAQCQSAPAPATQQTSPHGSDSGKPTTTTAAPASGAATPAASSNQPATASFDPVDMPDQQLPTIVPVDSEKSTSTTASHGSVSYSLSTIGGNHESDAAVLGAMAQTPLQPSAEGWVIFGIAWYWWVVMIVAIVALGRFALLRLRARRRVTENS